MKDDRNSTERKEAAWRLMRLAKSALDDGRIVMASRLLGDAVELMELEFDLEFVAPRSGEAGPDVSPHRNSPRGDSPRGDS